MTLGRGLVRIDGFVGTATGDAVLVIGASVASTSGIAVGVLSIAWGMPVLNPVGAAVTLGANVASSAGVSVTDIGDGEGTATRVGVMVGAHDTRRVRLKAIPANTCRWYGVIYFILLIKQSAYLVGMSLTASLILLSFDKRMSHMP